MEFPEHITIDSYKIKILPRYCETDQGGVIHHGVFPIWLEMGRTELLRANKVAYKDLEAAGVYFVIAALEIKYRRPAHYDEPLELETVCTKVTASKIEHGYKLVRVADGILIAEGATTLACISKEGKVRRIPEFMYPSQANMTV